MPRRLCRRGEALDLGCGGRRGCIWRRTASR
ncbi:hypothetical protein MJ561_16285 [Klebsiella pneumoniae]|nr:hypothetical protein MJ561_16285 [Klebsiella pneumoniae]